MATYILVPGAWHGSWCWERISRNLMAAGHHVESPDLYAIGVGDCGEDEDPVGRWAAAVAELVLRMSEPVILVGHSRGGL